VSSPSSARIEVASRTDRGVSAIGNALTLTSGMGPSSILRALNGIAPDIVFTAASEVLESFRVRAAARRTYRYFEPTGSHDFRSWPAVARRFTGTIDVRSLGRALPVGDPVRRTVESVTVTVVPGGAVIEIQAPSFVWGMVRKIVAALREVETGRLSVDRLDSALQGHTRLTLPMAEPERLVLWSVDYSLPWEHLWRGPNRHQTSWLRAAEENLWARREIVEMFRNDARPGAAGRAVGP